MLKSLLISSALVAGCLTVASAQATTLHEGRSTYMHSHHHAAHQYHMTYGHHNRQSHSEAYGVGSSSPRTTATGGNAGGYSTRN